MLSFAIRVTDAALAGLLDTYIIAKPGSKEWEMAKEQLEQTTIPVKRHKQRMSALYVDAVAPERWNRPTRDISQTTAHAYLQDAANDYSGEYDRYTNPETYKPDDPDLYTALETWVGRPPLPIPERSELPPWLNFKLA